MRRSGEQEQGAKYADQSQYDHPQKDSRDGGAERAGEAVQTAPLLLVGLLLLVSVWWDGAFDLRYWAPLTLVSLVLLLALALAGTLRLPARGPAALALAAICAFAAWAALSAAWAESASAAWEGAARTVLYAATFALALTAPAGRRGRTAFAVGLLLGVVATALATEARLLAGETGAFLAGRLNDPIGYRNGTAALFALAAWPLVGIAARRGVGAGLRAAALAALVLVLGLAFLTQSRGMLVGLVVGGAVSLAIGPDRLRRCWVALAAAGTIAIGSGSLLEAYHASGSGTAAVAAADVRGAGMALALLCVLAFAAGLFAFVFDNGLRAGQLARGVRRAAGAGLAAVALLAAAAALLTVGNPVGYAEKRWEEFSTVETTAATGTRLGTVSGPRYDIWRVAVEQFAEAPLAGTGEGSFSFAYFRERRTDRNLDDAHSLPLRLLAETGLIGFGLLALWLGATGVAIGRNARAASPGARIGIAGLAAAGAVVVAQSSVDWLWQVPALFGLGVLALGLAAREEEDAGPLALWPLPRAAASLLLTAAMVAVASLFLSDIYVREARSAAFDSPRDSLRAARSAAQLNPVSVTPLYLQAAALEDLGRRDAARRALLDALELEPSNFVTLALLGDLEVRGGNRTLAHRYYRRALMLNPRDSGLIELSERTGSR